MSSAAEVTVKIKSTDAILGMLNKRVQKGLDHAAVTLQSRIQKSLKISNNLGMDPSSPGSPPNFGIGDLLKSIVVEKPGEYTRKVVTRLPQARLMEFGGLVSVKQKKFLTIPISPEAKAHSTRGKNSRAFPKPLFFMPSRTSPNEALLVERGRGGQLIPHYALRKSVYIPARPFMRPAALDPAWQRMAAAGFGDSAGLNVVAAE